MSEITRRSFVRKSTAAAAIAGNAAVLNGLINASASADGTGSTAPGTTQPATTHCPAHGSSCTFVTGITISFNSTSTPPPVAGRTVSGRIFHGTVTVNKYRCNGTPQNSSYNAGTVHSGGYRSPGSNVNPGDDTTAPAGTRSLTPTQSGGGVPGYPIDTSGTGRTDIEFHGPGISEGCIVFDNEEDWENFRDLVNNGNDGKNNCVHGAPPDPIPITINYTGTQPNGNEPGP